MAPRPFQLPLWVPAATIPPTNVLGGTMRATTLLVCLLLVGAAVGCSSGKSQVEIQKECQAAITAESTRTNRPDACKDLSRDDYEALLMAWTLRDQGLVDEDGNVDMENLINGATATP